METGRLGRTLLVPSRRGTLGELGQMPRSHYFEIIFRRFLFAATGATGLAAASAASLASLKARRRSIFLRIAVASRSLSAIVCMPSFTAQSLAICALDALGNELSRFSAHRPHLWFRGHAIALYRLSPYFKNSAKSN